MEQDTIKPEVSRELAPRPNFQKDGRFAPGNQIAKGRPNPQAGIRQKLHAAFLEYVGTDRLTEVIERHLELIKTASPKDAAQLINLLYAYALGKPIATVDVTHNTTNEQSAINLDDEDVAALERMRAKLTNQ